MAAIGNRTGWLDNLIGAPERVGGPATGAEIGAHRSIAQMGPAPDRACRGIGEIAVAAPSCHGIGFIKYWTRGPGNAIVRADGPYVAWMRDDHCGRRNPLDDLG